MSSTPKVVGDDEPLLPIDFGPLREEWRPDHFRTIQAQATYPIEILNYRYATEAFRKAIVTKLIHGALEHEFVEFSPVEVDDLNLKASVCGRLTCVPVDYTKSMDARVQQRAFDLFEFAIDWLQGQVSNFGSRYNAMEISKDTLGILISEARAKAKNAQWHQLGR